MADENTIDYPALCEELSARVTELETALAEEQEFFRERLIERGNGSLSKRPQIYQPGFVYQAVDQKSLEMTVTEFVV